MSGTHEPSESDSRLKFLAENAGIPELEAFEHDSGELEAAQDELIEQIETHEEVNELLGDPFFKDEQPTDDLTDEDLRFERTLH